MMIFNCCISAHAVRIKKSTFPEIFSERITAHQDRLIVSSEIAQQTMWSLVHGMVLLFTSRYEYGCSRDGGPDDSEWVVEIGI